jgi:hypothetical protein
VRLAPLVGLGLALLAWPASAQVTFDAKITADATVASGTSISTTNMTVGSGANRVLVVELMFEAAVAPTSVSVTWDSGGSNQAMTQLVTKQDVTTTLTAQLWGLVNPISGAKTLKAAWTNSAEGAMGAASWTGANQTGGATTFAHTASANGSASPASVSVTSATNNATMDSVAVSSGGSISSGNQTQVFLDNSGTSLKAAAQRAAGAASVSFSWTLSTSLGWAIVATDIVAAAGGGSTCQRTLLGVGC